MRITGHSSPSPPERRPSTPCSGSSTPCDASTGSGGSRRTGRAADPSTVQAQAASLANSLKDQDFEVRPGFRERAQALLDRPFDDDFARATAEAFLRGDAPPQS